MRAGIRSLWGTERKAQSALAFQWAVPDSVLMALVEAGLTLNVSKCIFAINRIFHLGHAIDEYGIRPDSEKISALVNFKINNVKTLRAFLGVASFYRRFVPDFVLQ